MRATKSKQKQKIINISGLRFEFKISMYVIDSDSENKHAEDLVKA
jgi:hypothetical protein